MPITYSVALTSEPTGDVTVTPSAPVAFPRARTSGAVTFTPQDWWKLQTVTVTPEETGRSGSDYTRTIAHSVTGADYESNNVRARRVAIAVEDRFHATASLELSSNTVNEDVGSIEVIVTAVWHSEYAPTRPHVYFLNTKDFYGEPVEGRVLVYRELLPPARSPGDRTVISLNFGFQASEFEEAGDGTARFTATQKFTLTIHDDAIYERDEDTAVLLRNGLTWDAQGIETEEAPNLPGQTTFINNGLWQRLVIVDNDPSGITFPSARLEVTEEDATGAAYTLEMVSEPAENVFIDISGTEDSDVTVSPPTVTFTPANWDTPKTVRVTAAHDDDLVDDEVTLTHRARGPVPGRHKAERRLYDDHDLPSVTITVKDNDVVPVSVSFEQAAYTVAEGDDVTVKVTLSADPERRVVVPITASNQGGASNGDYSGVPADVTFESGDTEKSFTFTATDDTVDDDDESVKLSFGSLPAHVSEGTTAEAVVSITDNDDPQVSVSFEQATYTVAEGDSVTVKVTMSADPKRQVVVPITASNQGGASDSDYSGVPANVTFESGETEKEFTFTATDDTRHDEDESVRLAFGTLPDGVTEGTTAETTISITDDDAPSNRLRSLVVAPRDIDGFHSDVAEYMVGVAAGVTQATITPTAFRSDDAITIDGTTVASGSAHAVDLSAGLNTFEVVVSSAGSSDPTTYTVYIGRGTTEHGGWKAGDDLDTLRAAGNVSPWGVWSDKTTLWVGDRADVKLYAYNLAGGARDSGKDISLDANNADPLGIWSDNTTLWVADLEDGKVYAYTLASGARDSSQEFSLISAPSGTWSDGATIWFSDFYDGKAYAYTLASGARDAGKDISLDASNTVPLGMWSDGATLWVVDVVDKKLYAYALDGGARVPQFDISLHSTLDLANGIWGSGDTVWVVNDTSESGSPFARVYTYNNVPVAVSFDQSSYAVAEGDSVTVKVVLSADPKRQVVVPITAANQDGAADADYSGVPANVTFNSGDTEKTFTFTATDDTADDDDESVKLGFGTLPAGVAAGTNGEAVVSITDNDDPQVSVSFESATYTVGEDDSVTVKVTLNADPERTVTIPISKANQGGASNGDYSGVPANVTFNSGDTEKAFTFSATDDTADDDDESVKLSFGTLPARVSEGTISETTVSINDDDDPQVSVSFESATFTVAEGDSVTVKVTLSADPERTVTIPVSKANEGGASNSDYSGVPANVTFDSGDTEKTFTFTATDDTVDDDDESVKLSFGTLPTRVSEGTTNESVVNITDDDVPPVTISFERAFLHRG